MEGNFGMDLVSILLRWIHVVAGIMWIGLLYWFNFINVPFQGKIEADTKKIVAVEMFPRVLYWFRWGAMFTWVTGVLMLLTTFYMGRILFEMDGDWGLRTYVALAVVFLGFFVYDWLYKGPLAKNDMIATAISAVLVAGALWIFEGWAGWSYRGYVIHLGAMFGTFMMMNVWMVIWPAQQKIIPAIKAGEAPDMALVGLASMRSKHNTYMSVPLVWTMLSAHSVTVGAGSPFFLLGVVLVGWGIVWLLYRKSAQVEGM